MSWWNVGGMAVGAISSYAGQKSGQAPGFGGGMDFANKISRQPMIDTLGYAKDIYGQAKSGINDLMQQGFDLGGNMVQSLQPYMDYGNQMLQAGGMGMGGQLQGANALYNFDPTQYNAQFQGTGAVGPQFNQGAYNQTFGNYSSAIQPMLQSISQMNANALNRQALPGMTANAITSGNMSGTKVPMNAALLAGETAQANAGAAGQLYGQGAQQGNQVGAAYGQSMADAVNRAMLQNSSLSNQLNFNQAGQNQQSALAALGKATDAYGNIVDQTNPYWAGMTDITSQLPVFLANLGMAQRDAPMDWLKQYQDMIATVGNFGAPGGGGGGGGGQQGMNYGQVLDSAGTGMDLGGRIGDLFKTAPTA